VESSQSGRSRADFQLFLRGGSEGSRRLNGLEFMAKCDAVRGKEKRVGVKSYPCRQPSAAIGKKVTPDYVKKQAINIGVDRFRSLKKFESSREKGEKKKRLEKEKVDSFKKRGDILVAFLKG